MQLRSLSIEPGTPGQVLVHLAGQPLEVIAAVEAAAATKEIAQIRGKFAHIFGDAPQVAAFVWAAKPWLRYFTVNGVPVMPPPQKT